MTAYIMLIIIFWHKITLGTAIDQFRL